MAATYQPIPSTFEDGGHNLEPRDVEHEEEEQSHSDDGSIPLVALLCLIAQHASNSWSERSLEFTSYLLLITLFPTTLLPASFLGLAMTLFTILFASRLGQIIDTAPRLSFMRRGLAVQKLAQVVVYTGLLLLFSPAIRENSGKLFPATNKKRLEGLELSWSDRWQIYGLIGMMIVAATIGRLATTGIDLSIDRDWIMVISSAPSNNSKHAPDEVIVNNRLTTLNTALRRTSLLTRLGSPLLVSLIGNVTSYRSAVGMLLVGTLLSGLAELLWVGLIWRKFPALQALEASESREWKAAQRTEGRPEEQPSAYGRMKRDLRGLRTFAGEMGRDWVEFAKMDVFLSSLAISSIYLTTLSFDGLLISYLISYQHYSDIFVSLMRGISVLTGLGGTVIMPWLSRRLGLVRAGSWSLWSEIFCLIPVVVCLHLPPNPLSPAFIQTLSPLIFFTFLSLSRIGLYSFDLVQTQQLQVALMEGHAEKRNKVMGMQVGLQNLFDLARFGVVLVFNRPEQFKWTGLVTLLSVTGGGIVYTAYVYKIRGHLIHWTRGGHKPIRPWSYHAHGEASALQGREDGESVELLSRRVRNVEDDMAR